VFCAIWQGFNAGTSRVNPLTGEALFSHSIIGHYSVAEMWRHAQGENLGISEVWGLSGFAPDFVGIPENANQIEHMSISTVLQLVLDEPIAALDGIEQEKVITGDANQREASADMALNNAIHRIMVASFNHDGLAAVEQLRCTLKSDC